MLNEPGRKWSQYRGKWSQKRKRLEFWWSHLCPCIQLCLKLIVHHLDFSVMWTNKLACWGVIGNYFLPKNLSLVFGCQVRIIVLFRKSSSVPSRYHKTSSPCWYLGPFLVEFHVYISPYSMVRWLANALASWRLCLYSVQIGDVTVSPLALGARDGIQILTYAEHTPAPEPRTPSPQNIDFEDWY